MKRILERSTARLYSSENRLREISESFLSPLSDRASESASKILRFRSELERSFLGLQGLRKEFQEDERFITTQSIRFIISLALVGSAAWFYLNHLRDAASAASDLTDDYAILARTFLILGLTALSGTFLPLIMMRLTRGGRQRELDKFTVKVYEIITSYDKNIRKRIDEIKWRLNHQSKHSELMRDVADYSRLLVEYAGYATQIRSFVNPHSSNSRSMLRKIIFNRDAALGSLGVGSLLIVMGSIADVAQFFMPVIDVYTSGLAERQTNAQDAIELPIAKYPLAVSIMTMSGTFYVVAGLCVSILGLPHRFTVENKILDVMADRLASLPDEEIFDPAILREFENQLAMYAE